MKSFNTILGSFVKGKMEEKGVGTKEVASLLLQNPSTIRRKKRGARHFTLDELLVLSHKLGFTGDELFSYLETQHEK